MLQTFRMIQLALWHGAILKKRPTKVKQRVKLEDIGLVPTIYNPIISSPLECTGTVAKIYSDKVLVKWDNGCENIYPPKNLLITDFPLKSLPQFPKLDEDNPNITFKELEHYKLIEKEWHEHEARKKVREEEREQLNRAEHVRCDPRSW